MAKLLLITFIFSVCFYLNYGLELTPICKNSTFEYQNKYEIKVPVNSIYKINYEVKFSPFEYVMIKEDFVYKYSFYNDAIAREMEDIRRNYNKKIVKIYSNQYINQLNQNKSNTEFSEDFDEIKNYEERVQYFGDKKCDNYCFEFNSENLYKIGKGLNFLKSIDSYINKQIFDQDEKKSTSEIENLLKSIDEINDKHQIASISSDPIDVIVKNHQILLYDNFIIKGYSKTFFDLRNSATLMMEIVLPFWNKNYVETDVNCLTTDDLPHFYRNNRK